jgi:two-component system sensor histidine kinase BaeS
MRGSRFSLRTRLVVAMVLVALGVLALSYLVTYVLVRRSLEDNALSNLRNRATELEAIAQQPDVARLPARRLQLALRLTDIRAVAVRPNGEVVASGAQGAGLPEPLTDADIRPATLLSGTQVSGSKGDTVFLAAPTDRYIRRARVVIVATDTVDTSLLRIAFPLLVVAGLFVLALAIGVAIWLARRLTRPIQQIEGAAQRLAGGDLSARATVPPSADGELVALAATLNDMAAQLEAAQGTERSFLLSISHDLRTPLTSIRGYAEALGDGTIDDSNPDARRRAAHVIEAEARRLERLVQDLLDLSRLDSHQFSLRPRPCNASAVVSDAAAAFVPQAQELGLSLSMAPSPGVQADLDPERLAQIVANLVENALKYATSRVEVRADGPEPGHFAIVVADDGPGIAPDMLATVFDRLYTVRETPGRAVGTGLGLAIVRELATAMGGRAWAETVPEGGSRLVVSLPTSVVAA